MVLRRRFAGMRQQLQALGANTATVARRLQDRLIILRDAFERQRGTNMSSSSGTIFISQSHSDKQISEKLVEILVASLLMPQGSIRCSSVDGYQFAGGAHMSSSVRDEVSGCAVMLALLSWECQKSWWVPMEIGAALQEEKRLIPLLVPGFPANMVRSPLSELRAVDLASVQEIIGLVRQLGEHLGRTPEGADVFLARAQSLATSIVTAPPATPAAEERTDGACLFAQDEDLLVCFIEHEDRRHRWLNADGVAGVLNWKRSLAQHRLDVLKREGLLLVYDNSYGLSEKGREVALGLESARAAAAMQKLLAPQRSDEPSS